MSESSASAGLVIRPVQTADLPAALLVNNSCVPEVNELTPDRLSWFAEVAHWFPVIELDGEIVGLMIIMFGPSTPYDSSNYLWFGERYDRFLYIDRIALLEKARGRGLGRRLYEQLLARDQADHPAVVAEVNILPTNEPSMRFHQRLGFGPVGARQFGFGIGRLRKIDTPAGEFEVLPVESSGWWYEKLVNGGYSSGQWSRTAYYAPKLGHPVAIEFENADHLGRLLKRERIDLLHAQTARGTP